MSLELIVAKLVEIVQVVPGIGRVHDYDRKHTPPALVQAELGIEDMTTPKRWSVRAYMWYRRGSPGEWMTVDAAVIGIGHRMVLESLWEINDAQGSEVEWRTTNDTIRHLFAADPFLLQDVAHKFSFPQIAIETKYYGEGLPPCHNHEMVLDIYEVENNSASAEGIELYTAPWNIF